MFVLHVQIVIRIYRMHASPGHNSMFVVCNHMMSLVFINWKKEADEGPQWHWPKGALSKIPENLRHIHSICTASHCKSMQIHTLNYEKLTFCYDLNLRVFQLEKQQKPEKSVFGATFLEGHAGTPSTGNSNLNLEIDISEADAAQISPESCGRDSQCEGTTLFGLSVFEVHRVAYIRLIDWDLHGCWYIPVDRRNISVL